LSVLRILPSARKHELSNDDIEHAFRNVVIYIALDADEVLHIGPGRDGALLELVVAGMRGPDRRIIHAMTLRPKLYKYLR